ncbi:PREDICTED: probable E3 ubiquitin ligase complex SCF subunit sconB [Theobroma cacao]|uniref:Probable E3 ubiquitin ligase complex SCF subunit sconB n=1 Tax=Theobroma cacao TaxID=3641 RepID=A0AB32V957_THECC|nr:PREDICTED: probable E3 ubiquitin ligase complex SCF subunit sconB [Theobroma cacao]
MAAPPASPQQAATKITDLDEDSLAHCAAYLSLQDLSNLAITSKFLKKVAYSDSIWLHRFRERWPLEMLSSSSLGVRKAYLDCRTALHQLKFADPFVLDLYTEASHFDHILLDKNDIIFSQGSVIKRMKTDSFLSGGTLVRMSDHNARITCMRLFPLRETSLVRSETQREENVLVTSSYDHSIRLWWKGACQRCFRGHNGAVSTLSDKLLGDGGAKVMASGGEDGTVRLWSLSSSGKRGQQALKATLYGHQKPVTSMSVAGHRTSLLVTMSKDSKVRVWDTTTSSAIRSSCCVGMTSVAGAPVDMKCHEALLYVAAGSSVVIVDLRTLQRVHTVAIYQPRLYSFAIMPSKSLICTGGFGKAMLWDIRRGQESSKPEAVAELDGHIGSVTLLHMDPYKIVTGGLGDSFVNAWETETGTKANSLLCNHPELGSANIRCSAMAVNACSIVTASYGESQGLVRFQDFSTATRPIVEYDNDQNVSKFWGTQSYNDSDGCDE